ncbi:uncharacterized protein E0L32_002478 [Thyridium curvatum]|uniref:BTB domain-containing protein n=1 Tax=Thyridium curvatum TaxID=1093900 RepID=A0A507BN20_9PEZI|nr:uncharacterized protein E0L32_002478 [Thyridium curvatum]TPX18621.1 hypothetical protein E0L32_002478 [Thyridium curvatum]
MTSSKATVPGVTELKESDSSLTESRLLQQHQESGELPINIDKNGDLVVVVGSEKINAAFKVCSRALCRASSVFRGMLMGNFREAARQHQDDWAVELPEEDPASFGLLMMIVHGRYDAVPDTLRLQDLYKITILTDKYDMTSSLRPWARKWCDTVRGSEDERLIWVGWELGDEAMFSKAAKWLYQSWSMGDDGNMRVEDRPLHAKTYLEAIGILAVGASRETTGQATSNMPRKLPKLYLRGCFTWILGARPVGELRLSVATGSTGVRTQPQDDNEEALRRGSYD